MLFESKYKQSGQRSDYDIAPDGQRFLMVKAAGDDGTAPPPSLMIVQHFDEELKRLVPASR